MRGYITMKQMTLEQQMIFINKAKEFGYYKRREESKTEFESTWNYIIRFQFYIIEIRGHCNQYGQEETTKIIPQKY